MRRELALLAALAMVATLPGPAMAATAKPTRVGQCVATTLKTIGTRLEGVADSGDYVEYGNGIVGVSYEQDPAIAKARVGDKITLCLVSLPKNCPPGDTRGKMYSALDLRSKGKWTLPDAEHMCGGA